MWLLVFICVLAISRAQDPRVNTTQGIIIGRRALDGDYLSFYGIHYAGDTSGANRFKAPSPAPKYPGDYHAIDTDVICAQPSYRGIIGVENCLMLNVLTKNLTTPKPVMVWIEGEDYESTSGTLYSFRHLVESGLVVVSMNYRLSIFGFLCLGVEEAPGNAGLKDVIQGLQWIRENIAGFGGDPNNVMLVGHGSAAAMVDLITLSPLSNDLVHKALVLSGSALAPWAVSFKPLESARYVGAKLEYTHKSRSELAKLLAGTDLNVLNGVLTDNDFYNASVLFAPCVEDVNLNPNETVLSDAPINILRSGKYSKIPYVAGYTDREGTVRAQQAVLNNWLSKMEMNFKDFIQTDLSFKNDSNKTAVAQEIREFYFAKKTINMDVIEDYLDYHGDVLILIPIMRGARERALTSPDNVRLFEYAYRGSHNSDWTYPTIPINGAKHGAILNYLFDFDLRIGDKTAQESITKRIVGLAFTGKPFPMDYNATTWDAITPYFMHMLYMSGSEVADKLTLYKEEMQGNLNQERTEFWSKIFDRHYEAPKPVSSAQTLIGFHVIVLVAQLMTKLL
ncbi:venom carboxylesterase-6-like [Danaus plexippus]|uniref:venom carboxylesterase-6-like n=1 Tax=Danaus plexippus TaxID=13037 RepID=UPI002AB1B74F|nr:venom carboxylesterase-6-like [Danaus plexippus]